MVQRRLLSFVCALLVALGALIPLTPVRAASTGSIAGTVIDSQTGQPVAGVAVVATSLTGRYEAKTNAKGQFTIVGVVLDTYTVAIGSPPYQTVRYEGTTVTADEAVRLDARISKALTKIGGVGARSRPVTSAYQPSQTVDRYTLSSSDITQLLGDAFDTDQSKLLSRLPSVTIDRSGTPLIRGGYSFQTSFQYEGIDYTTPNRSALNRFQNNGNSNLLNGVGSLEIIPGGGDATHGDTGTGLIALTAKRGTYPGFANVDFEAGTRSAFHEFAFEYGIATPNKRLSNYFSYVNQSRALQYGPYGTPADQIGASATAPDPYLNSNVNAHLGAPYTTAYFNASNLSSSDFIENLVYKFGKDQGQSLQFFAQSQSVRQQLNYGGIAGLAYPDPAQLGATILPVIDNLYRPAGVYQPTNPGVGLNLDEAVALARIAPHYPIGTPGAPLADYDAAYSPFSAYKLEYSNIINPTTVAAVRLYRTDSDQSLTQAEQGLYTPENGGKRLGVSADLTKAFAKHLLQIGGKYEYARPFGTTLDAIDYNQAYTPRTQLFTQLPYISVGNVIPDFVVPAPVGLDPNTGNANGTPGCYSAVRNGGGNPTGTPCGYLATFFGNGAVPGLPAEQELPTAKQQVYGLYFQDTWSPNSRLKALLGLRLDGYNFALPSDPQDPPAVDGIRHQRLYQPHFGLSYRLTDHDAVRVNFGRTLSVPLPTFLGTDIDRSIYRAFVGIPSYDNQKGPFDPLRPNATQATYCGPGTIQTVNGVTTVSGSQPCANYADQLYWLTRNYRFGLQGQLQYPLRGATFTNYDASFSHEFRSGAAVRLTPFYRRGYDVVEQTRTLVGYDPISEVAALSPAIFSNLGIQKATGVEFDVTSAQRRTGLTYQLTGTYINQFGNDPPGAYLPTQSVALGQLYRSPNLSPFQSTLGVTYRTASGWRINPDIHYVRGYPYGAGVFQALTVNGGPAYVPLSDVLVNGSQSAIVANCWVDPQNWGTAANPNCAATRGTETRNSGPGTLLSKAFVNTDLTLEYKAPGSHATYGLALTNVFNQTADIPVANYTRAFLPVTTGNFTATNFTGNDITHGTPTAVGSNTTPYIVFPNQTPLTLRFYLQLGL